MEWFNPYFKDAFVHFDSWEHLNELLQPDRSYEQHQQRPAEEVHDAAHCAGGGAVGKKLSTTSELAVG
jgi:hypothetical protein